jgi:signal transduction histidine kinase
LYRSFILIPLSVRSRLIGFTGYMTEKQKESWTEDLITPLKLTNQMIANAIERSRIEQELKDAKERAEESDKLKTAFLSSMSHEIRTPMNHILGFIELLKDPTLSEKDKEEFMSIVRTSGNVLLRLIDDILDIAKIDSDNSLSIR